METNNGMFGQTGWICPKCGRVYSPFTHMCLYCKNDTTAEESLNHASKAKFKVGDKVMLKHSKSAVARYGAECEVKEAMLDDKEISWVYAVMLKTFPKETVIVKEDEIELA